MDYLRELMPKLPTTDFLKKEALLYVESRYGRVSTGAAPGARVSLVAMIECAYRFLEVVVRKKLSCTNFLQGKALKSF
jgi:hypothetical protein